jgi:metal-sulfur cluster biosynthetic enzyme
MHETPDSPAAPPFPYSGPADLQQPIERALHAVVDPELALSIVDVGLVYGVTVADGKVHVVLTMTSVACPVTEMIVQDVEAELHRVVPDGLTIAVELVWEPAWSAERMSPAGKAFMGW